MTWEEFWKMNPHIIRVLHNGYKEKIQEQDYLQYLWWGSYGMSAVTVAVERCLHGRRAKSKYVEGPVFKDAGNHKEELPEEELQRQRKLFVAGLEAMKTNFELKHKDDSVS